MDWKYDSWPSGEPYNWGGAERGTHPLDQIDFHVDLGCGAGVKKGRIGVDQFAAPGVNVVMDLNTGKVAAMAPRPGANAVESVPNGSRYHWPGRDAGAGDVVPWVDYPYPPVLSGQFFYNYRACALEAVAVAHGLPFETSSIKSIVSHHCLEHIGGGFIALIEEVYRVLEPDGIFRVITPLFPSRAAVDDPTHVRYFTETTWEFCCGKPGETHWMESFSVPYTSARFEKVHQDVTALAPPNERWKDDDAREIRVALRAKK
jgi:SAM-dependent methyltransferase